MKENYELQEVIIKEISSSLEYTGLYYAEVEDIEGNL